MVLHSKKIIAISIATTVLLRSFCAEGFSSRNVPAGAVYSFCLGKGNVLKKLARRVGDSLTGQR